MNRKALVIAFATGFAVVVGWPVIAEYGQYALYAWNHEPFQELSETTETLRQYLDDGMGGAVSMGGLQSDGEDSPEGPKWNLSWNSWYDGSGIIYYRFHNGGKNRVFAHSVLLTKLFGVRHLELGPGQTRTFSIFKSAAEEWVHSSLLVDGNCGIVRRPHIGTSLALIVPR